MRLCFQSRVFDFPSRGFCVFVFRLAFAFVCDLGPFYVRSFLREEGPANCPTDDCREQVCVYFLVSALGPGAGPCELAVGWRSAAPPPARVRRVRVARQERMGAARIDLAARPIISCYPIM